MEVRELGLVEFTLHGLYGLGSLGLRISNKIKASLMYLRTYWDETKMIRNFNVITFCLSYYLG